MQIEENVHLAPLTTLKIGGKARFFCRISEPGDLPVAFDFAKNNKLDVFVLGCGSNVLISDKGLSGLVVLIDILGVEQEDIGRGKIRLIAGAGESWDYIVALSVEKKLFGLENLSAIPGSVGAAPVQNIGAYGAEAKDTISWVEVFNPKKGVLEKKSNNVCHFGYRHSVFKEPKGRDLVITRVAFDLSVRGKPNLAYKDLADYFLKSKNLKPTLTEVRSAVIEIRKRKFEQALKHGSAGSFFKNPIVSEKKYKELQNRFPGLPGFKYKNKEVKLSLAWLIDKICNLKGFRVGDVGVSPDQALVLINYGGGDARDVINLAKKVTEEVKEKTGLDIEPEVRFIGQDYF